MDPAIEGCGRTGALECGARGAGPVEEMGPVPQREQWGIVREDYSEDGDAWNYFTHDQARSRAYRWGEDGLGGLCDDCRYVRTCETSF